MLEKAHETKNMNIKVPRRFDIGRSIKTTPTKRTRIPLTIPLTVPPIIYARAISNPDKGAVSKSGSCCNNFICNIEDEVFEEAFVRVFIMIRPGRINMVYDTP